MDLTLRDPRPLERLAAFITGLTPADRVAVIHHTDPDGVSSGVLAAKTIERARGKKADLRLNQPGNIVHILPTTVDALRAAKIDKVIITDLAVYENAATIKDIGAFADILILDHHKVYEDVTSGNVILVNPSQMYENCESSAYCAAKLVYDTCGKHVDLSDLDWVAAIGVIGDATAKHWLPFLQDVCKRLRISPKQDWFQTPLGEAAAIISSAEMIDDNNVPRCFETLYSAHGPADIIRAPIAEARKAINADVTHWVKNLDKLAQFHPDLQLIIYKIQPNYGIKSMLSTILSMARQSTTVVVVDTRGEKWGISARRQDGKVAVNDLLRECLDGLPEAVGGGHKPAAGGTVRAADYPVFEKRLLAHLARAKSAA